MKKKILNELVFERFSLYNRCVGQMFAMENKEITDSKELSQRLNIDSSLIRRDLSMIGRMGKRGMGYSLKLLKAGIEDVLGKNKEWNLIVVGVGNLGSAILKYFKKMSSNYKIVGVFDSDEKKHGKEVAGIKVMNVSEINKIKSNIDIAILTLPSEYAQQVANVLVENGIRGILNFAPVKLQLPDNVYYREIDLIKELDILTGMICANECEPEEKKEKEK